MNNENTIKSIVIEHEVKIDGIAVKREYLPSLAFVKSRSWISRVYFDPDKILIVVFLLNQIINSNEKLFGCVFNETCDNEIDIEKTYDDIFEFLLSSDLDCPTVISTSALYNENIDFLLIYPEEKDLIYLFGDEKFINKMMPISFEMYKIYFNDWIDTGAEGLDINVNAMKWFWETYPK